jgi:predicted RNase H-like HicB family nuclease
MLSRYLDAAMREARYEILLDDLSYYGEIPGLDGVYSNAPALEECRELLREVLEEWVLLRLSRGLSIPAVDGLRLQVAEVA